MMQMQIDRENKIEGNSFVKSQDQQDIKSALNSPSIIDAVSTTTESQESQPTASSLKCAVHQVLKGVTALCGFAALGGVTYWLSSWFGASRSDNYSGSEGSAKDENYKNHNSVDLARSGTEIAESTQALQNNIISRSAVMSHAAVTSPTVTIDEEHVFSTDDLEYRQPLAFAAQPLQRKLLSTGGSNEYHYLASAELSNIGNGWGFRINGGAVDDHSGYSVSTAGDINGDGVADLVIGASFSSYVVFGKNSTWLSSLELSSLNGANGFKLACGSRVSTAGDINGDGVDDLAIGTGSGAYVIFGKNKTMSWTSSLACSSLNGVNGFKINAEVGGDHCGSSISTAGDINGDGIADLVIGAEYASPFGIYKAGASYVVFGKKTPWTSSLELSSLNGTNGFKINGEAVGDNSGSSVSTAGDINGDSIDDLVIGAWRAGGGSGFGASYVLFGQNSSWTSAFNLTSLNGANGFKLIGMFTDESGISVSGAGDINDDGIDDLVIGCGTSNSHSYVVFGKNMTWVTPIQLSSLNGANGFAISGTTDDNFLGSVGAAGDMNGDGIDDLVIGAYWASPSGHNQAGASFIVFGKKTAWTSPFLLSSFSGENGFRLNGEAANDHSGFSVSGAGDINGDGIDDLVIGASQASPGGRTQAGVTYVVFGGYSNLALVKNILPIYQGHTVVINSTMLAATVQSPTVTFKISNNQHGNFYLVSQASMPIFTFTTGQITAQAIQFTHDGSLIAPSYQVMVNDGLTETSIPQNATVNFAAPPTLINNHLTVNQGQTVVVTNATLSAAAIGTDTNALIFQISFMQHGSFALIPSIATAVTSFSQREIANNSVAFIHDNTQIKPSYKISIYDGVTTIGPEDAVVTFNAKPILAKNNFVFGQGQMTKITPEMLSATDDYTDFASLKFIVSNLQHGNFSLSSKQSVPIYNFLQGEVTAKNISFIHDGGLFAPSFQIRVSDGILTTNQVAAVISFDLAPILTNNQMSIGQGQMVVVNENLLKATDIDTDPAILTFIVSDVKHGRFDSLFNPGVSITQFTQRQISNNLIRFSHDNSLSVPSYMISVSDGLITTNPKNATVIFDLAPVLANNYFTVGQGQEVILTSSMLSATDVDNNPLKLLFAVSNLQNGQFTLATDASKTITQFVQEQIVNGTIKFRHDGTVVAPSYQISVSDGVVTTSPMSSQITFYQAPILTRRSLTLYQGQTVLISNATLNAFSPTDADALEFIISDIQHGKFNLITAPGVAIYNFTQQQIQTSTVQFTHDNSQITPSAWVGISDGFITTTPQSLMVNFDIAPVLIANKLLIHQGERVIITSSMLSATDIDSAAPELIFKIDETYHGQFELETIASTPVTSFQQVAIASGNISFVHDGSDIAPSYKIAVSDGIMTTKYKPAVINFVPNSATNSTTGTIIGLAVSGGIGLGILLFKKYIDSKTNKIFGGNDLPNRVCQKMLSLMKFSGCLGYMSSNTVNELRSAVMTLLKNLTEVGVDLNLDKMEPPEQQFLVDTIAGETAKVLLPQPYCCSKVVGFFKNYCVAEVTPELIEVHAHKILIAIKDVLNNAAANREIEKMLMSGEVRTRNPLLGSGSNAESKARTEKITKLRKTMINLSQLNKEAQKLIEQNKTEEKHDEQTQIELAI